MVPIQVLNTIFFIIKTKLYYFAAHACKMYIIFILILKKFKKYHVFYSLLIHIITLYVFILKNTVKFINLNSLQLQQNNNFYNSMH